MNKKKDRKKEKGDIFRVADPSQRENLGIIVQYKVKVKLCLGALGG